LDLASPLGLLGGQRASRPGSGSKADRGAEIETPLRRALRAASGWQVAELGGGVSFEAAQRPPPQLLHPTRSAPTGQPLAALPLGVRLRNYFSCSAVGASLQSPCARFDIAGCTDQFTIAPISGSRSLFRARGRGSTFASPDPFCSHTLPHAGAIVAEKPDVPTGRQLHAAGQPISAWRGGFSTRGPNTNLYRRLGFASVIGMTNHSEARLGPESRDGLRHPRHVNRTTDCIGTARNASWHGAIWCSIDLAPTPRWHNRSWRWLPSGRLLFKARSSSKATQALRSCPDEPRACGQATPVSAHRPAQPAPDWRATFNGTPQQLIRIAGH